MRKSDWIKKFASDPGRLYPKSWLGVKSANLSSGPAYSDWIEIDPGTVSLASKLLPDTIPKVARKKRRDNKSWIEFRFVDDVEGKPVPGINIFIWLPNNTETRLRSDENGSVKIENIPNGSCKIGCYIENARLAKTCNFVCEGETPSGKTSEDRQGCLKLVTSVAIVKQYKVKTGDTLSSIAQANGLSASDLSKFNWGTSNSKEVNKHMRFDIGCTKKCRKKNNSEEYIFDDSDTPGIIYIPQEWRLGHLETGECHTLRLARAVGLKVKSMLILPIYVVELYDVKCRQYFGEEMTETIVKQANQLLRENNVDVEIRVKQHRFLTEEETKILLAHKRKDYDENGNPLKDITLYYKNIPLGDGFKNPTPKIVQNLYKRWYDEWAPSKGPMNTPILVVLGTTGDDPTSITYGVDNSDIYNRPDFSETQLKNASVDAHMTKGMVILNSGESDYNRISGNKLLHELLHLTLRLGGHYDSPYVISRNPIAKYLNYYETLKVRQYILERFPDFQNFQGNGK